jgi:hypothetical protein
MSNRLIYEAIRAAREQAEEARRALAEASPASLEHCAEALNTAVSRLDRCRQDAPIGRPSGRLRSEALRLRADLRVLTLLLKHAAGYHAGWLGFSGSAWAGYTCSGAAAGVPRYGRLLTQG